MSAPLALFTVLVCGVALFTAVTSVMAQAPEPGTISPGTAPTQRTDYNAMVLAAVRKMPAGGGYNARQPGSTALKASIAMVPGPVPSLELRPEAAQPSFCSGATYHIFLEVLQQLIVARRLPMTEEELSALEVRQQPDGTGIWGRWNSNGPGTARLFYEMGLGRNFTAWKDARPGDFMKIWWTREIGSKEAGHSVIFLGLRTTRPGPSALEDPTASDVTMVRFWSSNLKMGYGEKEVEFYKIQRVLFSRLENPVAMRGLARLPKTDDFLAGLLKVGATEAQVYTLTGVTDPPTVPPHMPPKLDASPDIKSAAKVTTTNKPAEQKEKPKSSTPASPGAPGTANAPRAKPARPLLLD